MTPLTENTQAILLLCAPLLTGGKSGAERLLSLSEYNRLAKALRTTGRQPADLLGPNLDECFSALPDDLDEARLRALLARGFQLSQAVDAWHSKSIWVISRADPAYPKRLKQMLKEEAPVVLYGIGDLGLLDSGGLAVVGSRHVDDRILEYTANIGRLAASGAMTVVSGGAKGIDSAAMGGALDAEGTVVGILADSLEKAALAGSNRLPIRQNRLVLISPYDPKAGFNVGHAMQRNKLIYALSEAALVVNSDFNKGGTWEGAKEQLDKYRFCPVFVRNDPDVKKGNQALIRKGGIPWPEPENRKQMAAVVLNAGRSADAIQPSLDLNIPVAETLQETQPSPLRAQPKQVAAEEPASGSATPKAALLDSVKGILMDLLSVPLKEEKIADQLGVSKSQAKDWLAHFVGEGVIEKLSKPVRYKKSDPKERLL